MTTPDARLAELEAGLADVRGRIASACAEAGRDPADVTLIAVTKTWPASDVAALASLGVSDVAENKDQEARAKHAELTDLDVRWHFVGQLQRNKAKSVVRYADVVHSVDRPELASALASASAKYREGTLDVLLQVDLEEGASEGRGGVAPSGVAALADEVSAHEALRLSGLMAVAPLGGNPDRAFARLAEFSADLVATHPGATWISAGMSGDLESAVRHGATHVRVGSALLGKRVSRHGSVRP
ncbi:YggS family pyridoxal phosphate-dependent enzyme [Cryptosporangium phraense]|uniref:Pyridoxal phosphate homeostasis protein n=1 Tax=Cryptosporangium phraense TaxID=2593070 RepID=A0A545AK45_9ACTN|nr:YggS family pyridoxal phosphate-dependent enzyme [Cryptosporangium phraense]TQS41694.1 YggS family pyridoxal phosphate-dependent enzyme [Cryptosporangium phraense]